MENEMPQSQKSKMPESILFAFYHFSDIDCWVICNQEKQPVTIHSGYYNIKKNADDIVPKYYSAGNLLRWKTEPQDHVTTLDRIKKVYELSTGYGFGILLGHGNKLCCFDFDHAISRDGRVSKKIWRFLTQLNTFVEISSSGTGLHAFVIVDGETEEYGFAKEICDGKFYNYRFIKLTGDVFFDFDLPIRVLNEYEYRSIKNVLGELKALPKIGNSNNYHPQYDGDMDCDWNKILSDANIRFVVAPEYIGKERKRGDEIHTGLWACRIQCPNITAHTGYQNRLGQFNPDVAILTLWDDGLTSVVCNHNHCDGKTYRPNLLQMLWTQVKEARSKRAKRLLEIAGVRF